MSNNDPLQDATEAQRHAGTVAALLTIAFALCKPGSMQTAVDVMKTFRQMATDLRTS